MKPGPTRCSATLIVALAVATSMGGCLKRTIAITSAPSGALVRLNDIEVGRTPLEVDFTYYGAYDVQLNMDGYEPHVETMMASAPFFEYPGPDLIAEALPGKREVRINWHFTLVPSQEASAVSPESLEAELLARAAELQAKTEPGVGEVESPKAQEPR